MNNLIRKIKNLLILAVFGQLFFIDAYAAIVQHSGTLAADETWSANDVHRVVSLVTVPVGINLIIEPGTIIKFNPWIGLRIYGNIDARGTVDKKIIFTSYRDDGVGGDTNVDGVSYGQSGDWNQIYFSNTATETLTFFENVVVRFGGSLINSYSVHLENSNITIKDSEISHSGGRGLYIYYGSPTIENCRIVDNKNLGVYINQGTALLDGNEISRNGASGIYSDRATPTIENNRIQDNASWGIYHYNDQAAPVLIGNTITGNVLSARLPLSSVPNITDDPTNNGNNIFVPNRINGLWILGGNLSKNLILGTQTAASGEVLNRYHIANNLTVNNGISLSTVPGTTFKFAANGGLIVNGTLDAAGTATAPIVFTSEKDDTLGGDMNADGYATSAVHGDWLGITFNSWTSNASVLSHAVVKFAGYSTANIHINQSGVKLSHVEVSNSSSHGIRVTAASPSLTDLHIYGNHVDGVHLTSAWPFSGTYSPSISNSRIYANFNDGVEVIDNVNLSVTGSELFGNLGLGIRNISSNPNSVTATDNWWGAVDGPGGSSSGSGDEISDKVVISGLFGDDFKTDGTEYVYFNAGGANHTGYKILTPNVTGTASSEWGTTDARTILYDINKTISADFTGLSNTASYTLLVDYLNRDSASAKQKLITTNGYVIHENRPLPSVNPALYAYQVPRQAIDNGNLNLQFITDSAPRVVVSGMYLLKQTSTDITPPTVQITAPVENAIVGSNDLTISGTAIDTVSSINTVEIGIQASAGQIAWYPVSSIDTSGNWIHPWVPSGDGAYLLYVRATDSAGNQQLSSARNITVDTSAPASVTDVRAGEGVTQLSVLWLLSADDGLDVNRYEIYRRTGPGGELARIAEVSSGINRYDDVSVEPGTEYYYFIRVVDQAGNISDSNIAGPFSRNDALDVTSPENVSNFTAQASQVNGGDISAYLSWTPAINSEHDLVNQRLSVSVDTGTTFGTNAPDYNNGLSISVGGTTRSYQLTGLTANTNYTFKLTTVDEVPNESSGATTSLTPTGNASEYITICGTLEDGRVFEAGTYVANCPLKVPVNATVTLKPGVIIKFHGAQPMTIEGTLLSGGAEGNPVVFTAFTDDSYGGDTNGDGPSVGSQYHWGGLSFRGATSSKSYLKYSVVAWGGANGCVNLTGGSNIEINNSTIRNGYSFGIYTSSSSPRIENSTISDNGYIGLFLNSGSATLTVIRNNTISRNKSHGIYSGHDIYSGNYAASIHGNTITDNAQYGIYFYAAPAIDVITGNTITGNRVSMMIPASGFPDQSNTVTPNTEDYIQIRGNTITRDMHLASWANGTANQGSKYLVYSGLIRVPEYLQLTVDPGVITKFSAGTGIKIDGALHANGTAEFPIVFTSINEGSAITPKNGDWQGISMYDSVNESFSRLNHIKVHYAAYLHLEGTDVAIENSEISNSSSNGIRLINSSSRITGNKIWGNTMDGIRVEGASNPEISFNRISTNLSDGIEVLAGANASASNNQIFLNREFGLRNGSTNAIDASQTWWGDFDSTGPQHTSNILGTGNEVSDNVIYADFQTTAGLDMTYSNLSAASGYSVGSLPDSILTNGTLSDEWDATSLSPDKTMAWDANAVSVDFTGLDAAKNYKIRVSYFNGDAADVYQSITDGSGNPVHASMMIPETTPVQYEFSIPQNYYSSGNISLNFVRDSTSASSRSAISEYWLMEDVVDFTPPEFESVEFNDIDGNGVLSLGDEYHFHFSEALDTSLVVTGTTDTNTKLVAEGGLIYGTTNETRWTADELTLIVTITDGYTVTGNELVIPSGLQDKFSNFAVGSQQLTVNDTVAPQFTGIDWIDVDASGYISLGDQYVYQFNEAMDSTVIVSDTTQANGLLRPAGGGRYGDINTVLWSTDRTQITVDVSTGFTIYGNEIVTPSSFVTDAAGNSVTGTQLLTGQDTAAPQITSVSFNDADGNQAVSLGDSYTFSFSKPMNSAALSDNTDEANQNLSPEARSYGTTNRIVWNSQATQVRVEISSGFTLVGNELVTPSSLLVDESGVAVNNTVTLTLADTIAPALLSVTSNIASPVRATSDYRITVKFNSSMNTLAGVNVGISSSGTLSPVVNTNGSWSSSVYPNDTYTTPPVILTSGMKGILTVDVSAAQDKFANSMQPVASIYQFILLADPPTITNYQLAPAINYLAIKSVVINGERENNTAIWKGATKLVAIGSGSWSANLVLAEGNNDVAVYAIDALGTDSATVTVKFNVDTIAPAITGISPANSSITKETVNAIAGSYTETGRGLDINSSSIIVMRNGANVTGQLTASASQLTFVPNVEFTEGNYTVAVQLQDLNGNQSVIFNSSFVIDRTPPLAPVVNVPPSVSTINQYAFTGTKEAYSAILVDGTVYVTNTAETTWSATVPLVEGLNTLSFTARDRAGNVSMAAVSSMTFDNTAPGAVTVIADGTADGTRIALDWQSYNELINGNDIDHYETFYSTVNYTNTSAATLHTSVPAGSKSSSITGLTRNTVYYVAVVAIDDLANRNDIVTPVAVTTTDVVAPDNVTNVVVNAAANAIDMSWQPSATNSADLAGYRLYFNNEAGVDITTALATYSRAGLATATAYPVRITALDQDGNESSGVSLTVATLLANPAGISSTPHSGRVDLTWTAAQPANLVKKYAIYASTTDFTSVDGMTPKLIVGSTVTAAGVAGLVDNTPYFFAVTTINVSNGENKQVSTITDTPAVDEQGPEITNVQYASVALVSGATLTASSNISLAASDPSGMSQVQFALDGNVFATDSNGSDGYKGYLNILTSTDGAHTLSITATDTLNNVSTLDIAVTIALAPPAAPVIVSPSSGTVTNEAAITLQGTAEADTQVQLYNNNVELGVLIPVSAQGSYSSTVSLVEGSNSITAAAQNRGGLGLQSSPVIITLDSSVPATPTGVTAQSRASGEIRLVWNVGNDPRTTGFNIYRSTQPFTHVSEATQANSSLISTNSYIDLPPADGTIYYSIVAINELGTPSNLSSQTNAESDRAAPQAVLIEYTPGGNYDAQTGRMAPGPVAVSLTVNEPLLTTPFLSIAPSNGVPLTINLSRVSDTLYTGSFDILSITPTGTAYAVFSARDRVGNRGTEITSGDTIEIDTQGPVVSALSLAPAEPILNDATTPVTVSFEIQLSEPVADAAGPAISYLLSAADRTELPVDTLIQADFTRWIGSVILPADAGLNEVENLSFIFSATDDLGNVSSKIEGDNLFQVYQGDLPPLDTPAGLVAQSLPGGQISLSWDAVEAAAEYQLYRQASGETVFTEYQRVIATDYVDSTTVDGAYSYTIASVRKENGQEGLSAQSAAVTVNADALASDAPLNLALELVGAGIRVSWQAPASAEPLTYNLYRSATDIQAIDGLTQAMSGVSELTAIDASPSNTEHYYVVTAVDEAGNESAASASAYLNFDLLPVTTLSVLQSGQEAPVVSWTHNGSTIVGYNLYLGANQEVQLNSSLLTAISYADTGYSGDTRAYTVTAVDVNSVESIGRSITLPKISASLQAGTIIKRGIMNRLVYSVVNDGPTAVLNIRLKAGILSYQNVSEKFSLAAGETRNVEIIFGGYANLPDVATLTTTVDINPNEGEHIELVRSSDILLSNAGLTLDLSTQEFIRGGTGRIQFTLDNVSDVDIEVVTATNSGNSPSSEIRFKLLDVDGNVLSTQSIQQYVGSGVITLASKKTVARIAGKTAFTSDWFDLVIPANAPDQIFVELEVDQLHYHLGRIDEVNISGLSSRREISLVNTSYYATVDNVSPASSFGDQKIIISGQTFNRASTLPEAIVPIRLIIAANGFERGYDITTDAQGMYSYTFSPLTGESGNYRVSAIHPDIVDRPAQGQFTISRVTVSPTQASLNIPRNYNQTGNFRVATGAGTTATNVRFEYLAAEQPGGVLPAGLQLTLPTAVNLSANQAASLNVIVRGDDTAADTGSFVLLLKSNEIGTANLGRVTVNYKFSAAEPFLAATPNYIETGVLHDDNITEGIRLKNKGLASLDNVQLALLTVGGAPAPAWLSLASSAQQNSIAAGEERLVQMVIAPDVSVAEGLHEFKLRVTSNNYATTDIGVYVTVTTSAVGSLLFRASDIYTATFDANGNLIQGLSGASIKLINEVTSEILPSIVSDSVGEVLFQNIPAGSYIFRATASSHEDKSGLIKVKPGIISAQDIFLDYNVVTVEWSVNEITIQDVYQITLNATYETDVPTAVVVASPSSVELPDLQPGDVYYGEFNLTNHGLIRADNLKVALPASDQYFRYELMGGLPDTLDAKESITVAYRAVMLQSFEADGTATGGACSNYASCGSTSYDSTCASGAISSGKTPHCVTNSVSSSCSTSSSSGITGDGGTGGGFGGWGGYGGSSFGTTLSNDDVGISACRPGADDRRCNASGNGDGSGH